MVAVKHGKRSLEPNRWHYQLDVAKMKVYSYRDPLTSNNVYIYIILVVTGIWGKYPNYQHWAIRIPIWDVIPQVLECLVGSLGAIFPTFSWKPHFLLGDSRQATCSKKNNQQMSSVQNPGWLFYIEEYTTQLYRDYFISHDRRIPINQPGLNGSCHSRVWFTLLSWRWWDF